MKFTCDSCGAQYMIGDDKLGKRGVKVRCKKCSYVIIVRPPGYAEQRVPTQVIDRDQEARTDLDLDPSPSVAAPAPSAFENDMDEPLTRVLEPGGGSADQALEEEALGLSGSGDGADSASSSSAASPEPFGDDDATQANGGAPDFGSIENVPKLRMGDDDSEGDERTRVDARAFSPAARSAASRDLEPAADESPFGANLGRGDPPAEGFEDSSPRAADEARTRRINHDAVRGAAAREPLGFDDSVVSAKISALDKDELDDMQSSLNASLTEDSWGARVGAAPEPVTDGRGTSAAGGANSMAALSRLAASQEEAAVSSLAQSYGASGAAVAASLARLGIAQDAPVPEIEAPLDFELKNAFDQMFGAASDEAEIDAGFGASPEPAPNEVFRSAYSENVDRKQTRVFDIDAMKQVQAEQDLAHGKETNGHAVPAAVAAARTPPSGPEAHEWYAAINDEQVGPMSFADLRAHWEKGDVRPSSLCWRVGMPDWTAIREVEELAVLGDMTEKPAPSTSRPEGRREDTDEQAPMMPPSISMPEEEPRAVAKSRAPSERPDAEEPSWRPSAASALASLAAQELGSLDEKPERDVAVGRAVPAASDALEKLLAGAGATGDSPASPFGAAELSASRVRPLPKAPDIASSVSLRDPVVSRPRNNLVPVAIVGGFVFLGLVVAAALFFRAPSPTPVPAPAQPVEAQTTPPPPPAPTPTAPPTTATPPTGEVVEAAPTPAPTPTPESGATGPEGQPSAAPPPGPGPSEGTVAAAPGTELGSTAEPKGTPSRRTREGSRTSREREEPRENRASAERERRREPEPDSPPASVEDELLGGPKRQRRVVAEEAPSDLPKQLEDSDILGELRRNKAAIQACRQKQASADPALEGTLTVNFVIEGSGRTKHWEVEPAKFKSSVVGKCVVEAVKKWTFPRFSGRPMPVDFPVRVGGG